MDASGPGLYGLLARLTLRHDVAEELMQELALRLLRSPGFAKAADPAAYAAKSAIHLAMEWRRRRCRQWLSEPTNEPAGGGPSPLESMQRVEDLERVMQAIGRLRGACQEAFVLRYVEQRSYEQIGRQLGKTEHQVRALCTKAMKRVRKLLNCT